MNRPKHQPAHNLRVRFRSAAIVAAIMAVGTTQCARAMEVNTGDSDLKVRWDNTFKYSSAFRVKSLSSDVTTTNPNLDDGDRNFGRGLVSNRLDVLSELDVVYKSDVGVRISAAGWYDRVYNSTNDNPGFAGGAVPNSLSVPYNTFTSGTRTQHGRDIEVLDLFVFAKTKIGDATLSGRLGQYSLFWGESLFFGDNGIAGGQGPTDYVKLLTVPNSQFKEIVRPVPQISGYLQISPALSVGAYVQTKWERNRLPAAGSYLSRADLFDFGGEQLYLPPAFGGPVARASDITPKNSGQWGGQLRWRSESLDTDFGFYAIRFNDKNPQIYLTPGRDYRLVFHEGTRAFGVSASRSFGSINLAGEASVRHNASLVAAGGSVLDFAGNGDNSGNALYPVGKTAHAQTSLVYSLERSPIWDGGLVFAEVAWNRRLSVTKNAAALDPNASRDALGLRVLLQPTYYQVFAGVDLTVPIGLGYNPMGNSSVLPVFNGGWNKGGDLSIGLTVEFEQTWKAGVNYVSYFGKAGGVLDNAGNYSFKQSLKDRNFISFTAQRTF